MGANMEQTRNDTSVFLEISGIESGTDTYPIGQKQRKYTSIRICLKNQMEQSEFHSRYLVYVQISISSFLPKERIPSVTALDREANPRSILYQETVAVGLAACLIQQGHNQWPDTDNVSNDLNQRRH